MLGMPDLVYRAFLALLKVTIRQEGILFKEEPNLLSRFEKVIVAEVALLLSRKDRDYAAGIEPTNQLVGTLAQSIARD